MVAYTLTYHHMTMTSICLLIDTTLCNHICNDSSRYIASKHLPLLFQQIQHNLLMSGYMSIVTKLSINTSKSRIPIFNIHPYASIPTFQYTTWTHGGKTVYTSTNLVTNINFITTTGIMSTPAPHKVFGVQATMAPGNTCQHAFIY